MCRNRRPRRALARRERWSPAASSATRACRYDERPMSPTTSPFGPLAVLLDPRAGHGVVAREVDAVEHALEARGLEYRLHVGGSSQELRDLSAAALDEGYRFLAAVGDDGARTIRYAHNVAEIGFHAAATIAASRGGARFHNLKRFAAFWRAYAG